MPNIRAYRGFSDKQLAKKIIQLNDAVDSIYESQSIGSQSYTKNLDRLDRQLAAAIEVWRERGGTELPEKEDDVPGGGRPHEPYKGGTDYSRLEIS